jgi:hypothetical protein
MDDQPFEPFRISMHRHFYRVAAEQKRIYLNADAEIKERNDIPEADDEIDAVIKKLSNCFERREQAAVIGITFAAMSLEAFFYDYSAANLGDDFAKEHVDRLDLPSKLLIVPRLVSGKKIEKLSVIFKRVRQLTVDRNKLVHYKSRSFDHQEMQKAWEFYDKISDNLRPALLNAVETVELVLKEIDRLDGTLGKHFNRVCRE